MKKLIVGAVLGGIVLASCGGSSGAVAATVDGETLTVGDVESLVDSGDAVVDKTRFAQILGYAIQSIILDNAAETEYGLSVTDDEIAAEADRLFEEVAGGTQTREEFLAENEITEKFLRLIASQSLLDVQLREVIGEEIAGPTADEIITARSEAFLNLTSACVSHILIGDEETALQIKARLEAEEDFATLAGEFSEDTASAANGGDLGCATPARYVEPFKDAVLEAPIGELYPDLVESEFGFHIILVTELTEPTLDEMPTDDELADGIRQEALVAQLDTWFLAAAEAADVTIEAEYGTWQANPPTVVPPTTTE